MRQGIIEELPVEADSVDLVISNCVINLSPEKRRVFAEIHRVLKPGGRFSISDVVAEKMPDWVLEMHNLYSACISGAISEDEYLAGLREAGLVEVAVRDRLVYDASQLTGLLDATDGRAPAAADPARMPKAEVARVAEALAGKVASIRVVGRKPGRTGDEKHPSTGGRVVNGRRCRRLSSP